MSLLHSARAPQTTTTVAESARATSCRCRSSHTRACLEAQLEEARQAREQVEEAREQVEEAACNPHIAGVLCAMKATEQQATVSGSELMTERWFAAFLLPLYSLRGSSIIDG